ncbi:ATP-binding cassette domain-containing protein, partial [bacterium]|nr:ATP-binding cassette domain-containing protein [bacterium]
LFLKTVLKNDGKIFAGLFMYMKGALPIRSNLSTDFVRLNYLKSARPLIVSLFKATRLGNRLNTLDAVIRPLTYVFIFAIISFMTNKGWESGITVAVFAGFSAALTTVFSSTRTLVDTIFGKIIQGLAIWQRSLEFLEIKPENPYSTISRLNPTGKIAFKNVSFRYPNNAEDTIKDISFEVESGEFIGITGESGCGKSTLMRMAYSVLEPSNGAIYYDRIAQSQANKRSLRENFGVITQDVKLINGSLRDNLLAGIYKEDSKIYEVLEASCLKEFVDNLPMGLETMMSESSTSFSMGQRQLIIIARALLKQPRILFMDEATSYLDHNTESIITKNIQQMGITRFAVAHRLSSIQEANRILMLGKGNILGFDSHSNLLQNCPNYKVLYESASSE